MTLTQMIGKHVNVVAKFWTPNGNERRVFNGEMWSVNDDRIILRVPDPNWCYGSKYTVIKQYQVESVVSLS